MVKNHKLVPLSKEVKEFRDKYVKEWKKNAN